MWGVVKARRLVIVHWSSHSERAVAIDIDVHLSLVQFALTKFSKFLFVSVEVLKAAPFVLDIRAVN